MDKQSLINQAEKIRQAMNVISVSGYGNIKTLGNCMDAFIELEKNIDSYEDDMRKHFENEVEKIISSFNNDDNVNNCDIVASNPDKPKPKRIKKEVTSNAEN